MKGIFYSLITALFVIPLLFLATVYIHDVQSAAEGYTAKAVGDKMASLAKSVDNDVPRATKIIARRAVEANIQHIEVSGTPLDDAQQRIVEAMLNGTVYGNVTSLDNFTLTGWAAELSRKGEAFGFATQVNVSDIAVAPYDSYHITVRVAVSVNMTDTSRQASLYRLYNNSYAISIIGTVDPLYLLNTNGIFKRTIEPPPVTIVDVVTLDMAVAGGYYMPAPSGPSLLDRMEGRLAATTATNGLETLVSLPDLQANGLPVKPDQNSADYLYFDTVVQSGTPVNQSSYAWLRLNAEQASRYGVTLVP